MVKRRRNECDRTFFIQVADDGVRLAEWAGMPGPDQLFDGHRCVALIREARKNGYVFLTMQHRDDGLLAAHRRSPLDALRYLYGLYMVRPDLMTFRTSADIRKFEAILAKSGLRVEDEKRPRHKPEVISEFLGRP